MKKTICLLLSACLIAALFAGCHGAKVSDSFTVPADFDESKTYNITFWAKSDSNATQVAIYEQAIRDFEAIYPNIHVTLRKYSDYALIYNDVITNIATDTTPNVCITYPDHIATYKTGENVVVPLDALMDDARYGLGGSEIRFDAPKKAEMVEKFLNECVIDGQQFALPYMRSTEAVYINEDLVKALGFELPGKLTWDFIWEVSAAAMEKNEDGTFKVNGQNVMIPFIYKSTDNMMITTLAQLSAPYSKEDGEVLIFNDTTKAFLYEIAEHAEKREFSTFKISSYPGNYLNAGQCIFGIDSTAGATWMGQNAPNMDIHKNNVIDFTLRIMEVPQYDPEHPKMISQGPSVCIFNKADPGEVLASWIFTQFLLTNSVQIPYAQTEGYVPVTKKAQESAEYQDYLSRAGDESDPELYYKGKIDATKLLLSHTEDTFVTPVFNGSADLRYAAGELIEEVVKARRRKITVDDAFLNDLFKTLSSRMNISVEAGSSDLGPLPETSAALLAGLGAAWVLIAAVFVIRAAKKKKKKK